MTAAGVSRGGTMRDEVTSMVGPDASDPLLHACFNAQLLAYSTDPALLDRSTEILMIMLEYVTALSTWSHIAIATACVSLVPLSRPAFTL